MQLLHINNKLTILHLIPSYYKFYRLKITYSLLSANLTNITSLRPV